MSRPDVQMRYQQKQQVERDQRKSDLVNSTNARARSSLQAIGSRTSSGQQHLLTASLGAGKVRQMFDERRLKTTTVTGIDKSYPLQPITAPTAGAATNSRRSPMVGGGTGIGTGGGGGGRTTAAARKTTHHGDKFNNNNNNTNNLTPDSVSSRSSSDGGFGRTRMMPLSADATTMGRRRNDAPIDDDDDDDRNNANGDHHHNVYANNGRYVLSSHITSADFLDNEQFPGKFMWIIVRGAACLAVACAGFGCVLSRKVVMQFSVELHFLAFQLNPCLHVKF